MNDIHFTADTHYYHENILTLGPGRPFASMQEMEDTLVENWNRVVHPGDTVYHLGDFAITWHRRDVTVVERIVKRLNGQIHLIYGNHDRRAVKDAKGFAWQGDYKRIKVDGQAIVLFHYPIASWHGIHRGAWHLHGHCHGSFRTLHDPYSSKRLDVGVDCWNFTPVSFDQVKLEMDKRVFVPIDHHGE